jgi:hypothetical protein
LVDPPFGVGVIVMLVGRGDTTAQLLAVSGSAVPGTYVVPLFAS